VLERSAGLRAAGEELGRALKEVEETAEEQRAQLCAEVRHARAHAHAHARSVYSEVPGLAISLSRTRAHANLRAHNYLSCRSSSRAVAGGWGCDGWGGDGGQLEHTGKELRDALGECVDTSERLVASNGEARALAEELGHCAATALSAVAKGVTALGEDTHALRSAAEEATRLGGAAFAAAGRISDCARGVSQPEPGPLSLPSFSYLPSCSSTPPHPPPPNHHSFRSK
jgi:hypothetical protein